MGALTGDFNDSPEGQIAKDGNKAIEKPEGKFETEFEGVFADAVNQKTTYLFLRFLTKSSIKI
jgi:hypothetical protein